MVIIPARGQRGTVFLELIIAVGVLAAMLSAIASLVVASYDIVGFSRTRITARHLANEKMELVRNLPYNQIAVQGGIPAGNLPQLETITRNGLAYTVRTNVVYVDDEFDGLSPTDLLPTDYKRVRVDVSWAGTFASSSTVTLVSDIAPKGVETTGGGGTLSILVFDAQAQPVTEAQVRIQNSSVNPAIDLTVNSDANGRVILPGSPACFECYHIEVIKEGYSSDRTYSAAEIAHPANPLATVSDQSITEINFAIDRLATLVVTSTRGREANYALLANQFFQLRGEKIIGTDIEEQPVYKYDQLLQTGGSGQLTVSNLEWGTYTLTLAASTWDLAGTNPLSPLALLPNTSATISFASVAHTDNSILFRVIEASGSAIAEAFVRLTKQPGFDEVLATGGTGVPDLGQAMFGDLDTGEYDVEASKSGYLTNITQTTVGGTRQETITLTRQ